MAVANTEKQHKILERFSQHGTELLNATQVSFTGKNMMFNVQDPVVYKITGTNNILVFGELRKSMSFEEIRKWLEQKAQETGKPVKEEEMIQELEGEYREHEMRNEGCTYSVNEAEKAIVSSIPNESDSRIIESDVKLIMDQVKLPREEIIEALKQCDYDVVNALVMLSKNK